MEDKVYLVLRDNAANMIKAMREASLPSLGCFDQSLELVVEDGVLSQPAVSDVLAICRTILSTHLLLIVIFAPLEVPQHRLQQDVRTRSLPYIWLNL